MKSGNRSSLFGWKITLAFFALVLCSAVLRAQTAPLRYWVQFNDKANSPYSTERPEEFLTQRSLDRRAKQGAGVSVDDLPVNETYIQQVLALGSMKLAQRSKWFNAISVVFPDSATAAALLPQIELLPAVREVKTVVRYRRPEEPRLPSERSNTSAHENYELPNTTLSYGEGRHQVEMINGHLLHALGYTGEGMHIAQFDAGWTMADRLPAIANLFENDQIALTRDFCFPEFRNVFSDNAHGTQVLSIMGANYPDSLVGTAPHATYYLFRTENPLSEYTAEEDNWVAGAEVADSLGIDIINSSLGYSEFQDTTQNHTYADMDGNTTRCTIAANMAAARGILVVNSAGNSGDDPWRYITAPSDGDLVLAVGAVSADSTHAPFSSYGPSADGEVKPNVCTMGRLASYAALDSTIRQGNGTSFSAPVMSGMAACLWQAFPWASASEIKEAIEQSAHLRTGPNDSLGYGIPDMWKAFSYLRNDAVSAVGDLNARVFPNPCADFISLTLEAADAGNALIDIYDVLGRRVLARQELMGVAEKNYYQSSIPVSSLSPGHYFLKVTSNGRVSVVPFQKILN